MKAQTRTRGRWIRQPERLLEAFAIRTKISRTETKDSYHKHFQTYGIAHVTICFVYREECKPLSLLFVCVNHFSVISGYFLGWTSTKQSSRTQHPHAKHYTNVHVPLNNFLMHILQFLYTSRTMHLIEI